MNDGFADSLELVDDRPTYRVGRIAFFLIAVGVGLASLSHLAQATFFLTRSFHLLAILRSSAWEWGVVGPGSLASFLGTMLLLNRTIDRHWKSRVVFLFVIQSYFFGWFCLDHVKMLEPGAAVNPVRRSDLAELILWVGTRSLGLVAMLIVGSLAWDVCRRLRSVECEPLFRASRSAATIGLTLWCFYVMRRVDWRELWPPRIFIFFDPQAFHIQIGAVLARAVSGFLAMILCGHAAMACSRELRRLDHEMTEQDPFRSRSEWS